MRSDNVRTTMLDMLIGAKIRNTVDDHTSNPGATKVVVKLVRGSRQQSHLLPTETKLLSEKSASATFFQ